jgi:hypothetical protein
VSSSAASKQIAEIRAVYEALLGEPLDGTARERAATAYEWESFRRQCAAMTGELTNIDDETLACGKDNRRVKPGGWITRKRTDGRTEWIPPPNLETGQARVNFSHHPARYLIPDDHDSRDADDDADDECA